MNCPRCQSESTYKNGSDPKTKKQTYVCKSCKRSFTMGTKQSTSSPKVGISLEEFRNKHDVEHIITKTLNKLDKNLVYEKADLIKLSGLPYSAQGLSTILETKSEYFGKTGGKIYYSHPDTIRVLKEQAKLN